mgnify:CR=1 FL=1
MDACHVCGKRDCQLYGCENCMQVAYCGDDCQTKHLESGLHDNCALIAGKGKSDDNDKPEVVLKLDDNGYPYTPALGDNDRIRAFTEHDKVKALWAKYKAKHREEPDEALYPGFLKESKRREGNRNSKRNTRGKEKRADDDDEERPGPAQRARAASPELERIPLAQYVLHANINKLPDPKNAKKRAEWALEHYNLLATTFTMPAKTKAALGRWMEKDGLWRRFVLSRTNEEEEEEEEEEDEDRGGGVMFQDEPQGEGEEQEEEEEEEKVYINYSDPRIPDPPEDMDDFDALQRWWNQPVFQNIKNGPKITGAKGAWPAALRKFAQDIIEARRPRQRQSSISLGEEEDEEEQDQQFEPVVATRKPSPDRQGAARPPSLTQWGQEDSSGNIDDEEIEEQKRLREIKLNEAIREGYVATLETLEQNIADAYDDVEKAQRKVEKAQAKLAEKTEKYKRQVRTRDDEKARLQQLDQNTREAQERLDIIRRKQRERAMKFV